MIKIKVNLIRQLIIFYQKLDKTALTHPISSLNKNNTFMMTRSSLTNIKKFKITIMTYQLQELTFSLSMSVILLIQMIDNSVNSIQFRHSNRIVKCAKQLSPWPKTIGKKMEKQFNQIGIINLQGILHLNVSYIKTNNFFLNLQKLKI